MKKFFPILLFLLIITGNLMAQTSTDSVPMADKLREDGKIWVVVTVIALIFAGIVINMLRLESKVGKIEKDLKIK